MLNTELQPPSLGQKEIYCWITSSAVTLHKCLYSKQVKSVYIWYNSYEPFIFRIVAFCAVVMRRIWQDQSLTCPGKASRPQSCLPLPRLSLVHSGCPNSCALLQQATIDVCVEESTSTTEASFGTPESFSTKICCKAVKTWNRAPQCVRNQFILHCREDVL